MNLALREHDKATRSLAKQLEDQGYAVIIEPSPEQIPFTLGGYIPDLLATKTNDNLVIEIKPRNTPELVSRYREVADMIQTHSTWRFLIKTFDEAGEKTGTSVSHMSTVDEIRQYYDKIKKICAISPELAMPYLWNTLITLLRHKASDVLTEPAELSDRGLINQLYTLGMLSAEQYTTLIHWYKLRNHALHELEFSTNPEEVNSMSIFIDTLLLESSASLE